MCYEINPKYKQTSVGIRKKDHFLLFMSKFREVHLPRLSVMLITGELLMWKFNSFIYLNCTCYISNAAIFYPNYKNVYLYKCISAEVRWPPIVPSHVALDRNKFSDVMQR